MAEKLNIYGKFEPWLEQYEVDRLGVARIVLCKQWIETPPGISDAPVTILPIQIPFVLFSSGQTGPFKHGIAKWCYEGREADNELQEEYAFEGSFNQEPIQTHPDFKNLLTKYGGSEPAEGVVSWPKELPNPPTNRGFSNTSNDGQRNPMHGVDSYLALGAVWTVTYVRKVIPTDLLDDVGCIVENPPGHPPTPQGRNWLKLAPTGRKRGNVTQISERYMLSGRSGWVSDIYKRNQYS
jgi:hypothetical protein